jgi:anti-sigma factor RsiW
MSHLGDALSGYLDDEVGVAERTRIEEHLEGCEACRDDLAGLASARSAVRGLPMLELPPDLLAGRLGWRRRRRGLWFRPVWAWAVSAAAVFALAAGLLIAPGQADSAFDLGNLIDRHVARVVVDPGVSTIRGPVSGP